MSVQKLVPAPVYDSAKKVFAPFNELIEVIQYRDLITQLVRRDVVARYKRSILGVAWTMLNPLGMMAILSIVYAQIFKSVEGYPAYVLSGLIAWNFFSQATSASIGSLAWGGEFFRRIYVPRSVFAISAIGTGLVNLVLSLVPLLLILIVVKIPIHWTIILVILPLLFLAMFALGVGLLISSIAIYFPDIVEMYQIVLQALFFVTPILFPIENLPAYVQNVVIFNPLHHLIRLFRLPIFYGTIPTASDILIPLAVSLVTLIAGWWIFANKSNEFAYRT